MLGIIVGYGLHKNLNIGDGFSIPSSGIGLGGALTIIYHILMKWHKFNEGSKLIVSFAALLTLIYTSYYIFKQ